jgi:ABC-type antimicrobial peptide transport system permease subunit
MNFADIIALALRNLRQSKLRTALTVIGVIVGVTAIVTMVSFGLGLQNNLLKDAFSRIDFFTSITVFGPSTDMMLAMSENRAEQRDRGADETKPTEESTAAASPTAQPLLDDAAIAELQKISGVRYVLPIFNTSIYVQLNGRPRRAAIGGAPLNIEYNPRFKNFLAGRHFASEDAREAVITESFLNRITTAPKFTRRGDERRQNPGPFQRAATKSDEERKQAAEAFLGKELALFTLPGANVSMGSVFGIPLLGGGVPESDENYPEGGPKGGQSSQFERHPYKIAGVLKREEGIPLNFMGSADIYLPLEQAKQFRESNLDPMQRMGEMLAGDTGYQSAEVRVTDLTYLENVKAEIKKRGFNFWNISSQIEEIKRIFLIVNASLALIGGIALLVASFGISNTMIMSIRERTREIGIMKAIGGSDGEIMRIFFVEASLIGFIGGVIGVIGGWTIDRVANTFANRWIAREAGEAIRHIEFFSIPWYLSAGAILFAVLISLIAAIYPAMHAARIDPIKALRHD